MKPILFNTDMVKAILDRRKTVTRRVVKPPVPKPCELRKMQEGYHAGEWHLYCEDPLLDKPNKSPWGAQFLPPFQLGDVLYVRETWNLNNVSEDGDTFKLGFIYKAVDEDCRYNGLEWRHINWVQVSESIYEKYEKSISESNYDKWRPSIFMPKEAARIFLRVTDVRAQRLRDMTTDDAKAEGAETDDWLDNCEEASAVGLSTWSLREYFGYHIWDRTLNGRDANKRYGWEANPWVWAIEFERCEKPDEKGA